MIGGGLGPNPGLTPYTAFSIVSISKGVRVEHTKY